ncbi:uncharacterized protein LAESUDRAFT_810495 [Laetiporus sulphureus 93-53]|uniref:Cell wall protein n=1 Tax=Laetiporus sulphureus 93-53 TaxID=1314785 RepID=A0A165FVW5_9APHY|nr:uncharacterized protein LAESUDRAFT_810495 [Laetiporus sulphureus 93-53]KZT09479.1 hypothetical protein LAESUDRAFT_810495 [Laetiporus sulphureus 93-53]
MLSFKFISLVLVCTAWALPLSIKREVPQEHSHNIVLASVRPMLDLDNPNNIEDPVFGLLGDAAAAGGAGSITNLDCLQQDTADQAFTNANAAGNVTGMVFALIYRALERNTGSVGLASVICNETATNPEVAAITQHQDPASTNATAINKAIALELATQIASVGGDPQLALMSGTFAAGTIGDPTAKGNTCDDADDEPGCIFTDNLLVDDATAEEISAAVAGISATVSASSAAVTCGTDNAVTVSVTATVTNADTVATATSASTATAAAATASTSTAATGSNLQTFTGAVGGVSAPAVTQASDGKFIVTSEEQDEFVNLSAALGRSCDVQHNQCADAANASGNASFTVSDCDTQDTECKAA